MSLTPVKFVTVERAFKHEVKVRAKQDLSGWVDRKRRVKWFIPAGRIGYMDHDKAREFSIKGFVDVIEGTIKPASEQEIAEMQAQITVLQAGQPRG
jgi:hypothetical protein